MITEKDLIELVTKVCEINKDWLREDHSYSKTMAKILTSDLDNRAKTRDLFRSFMGHFSLQGISDKIVAEFRAKHGAITYLQISRRINTQRKNHPNLCGKLKSFELFKSCGYKKEKFTCKNMRMLMRCPLRFHVLLKGVLNVKAYSFYFYLGDECHGDLITHIDNIILKHFRVGVDEPSATIAAKDDLIGSLTKIFGVGNKLANMTLSSFLMADQTRVYHIKVARALVAIDSLVHNFFHRTGALQLYECSHNYGPSCFKNCVQIVNTLSKHIDVKIFKEDQPRYFPRFVQHSIWYFCAGDGADICNGKNIDDSEPCNMEGICPVYDLCGRITLKP